MEVNLATSSLYRSRGCQHWMEFHIGDVPPFGAFWLRTHSVCVVRSRTWTTVKRGLNGGKATANFAGGLEVGGEDRRAGDRRQSERRNPAPKRSD